MDADQARAALSEVDRRRSQAVGIVNRRGLPVWFVVVAVVAILGQLLLTDLRAQYPEWDGWFSRWGVVVLVLGVLVGAGIVAQRQAAVSAHRSVWAEQLSALAVGFIAFYGLLMAIGMPMRYFRIPFDQTVSGVGAALLLFVAWAVWSRVRPRRADR